MKKLLSFLMMAAMVSFLACTSSEDPEEVTDEDPMEGSAKEPGGEEEIIDEAEDAVDEAGDAMEEAGEDVEDAVDEAGDAMEEAGEDVGDAVEEATDGDGDING